MMAGNGRERCVGTTWRRLMVLAAFGASTAGGTLIPHGQAKLRAQEPQQPTRPLYVMNRDGTDLRRVAEVPGKYACGSPCWSPDSKSIAFDAHGPNFSGQHVYIVELDSGRRIDLGEGGYPSWSPDGKQVAFHRYQDVLVVDADGKNQRGLIPNVSHPRWSPDGATVACLIDYGQTNVGLFDVASAEVRSLFDGATRRIFWGQSWSPDGRRLAMMREGLGGSHELIIVSSEGASRGLRVRHRGHMSSHTSWSADGKSLLVGVYAPRNGPRHLHVLDPDGREPPQPIPGQDPALDYCDGVWSPDGTQLAFSLTPNLRSQP